MRSILELQSWITGAEYDILKKSTPKSRQKIRLFSCLMLIPILIWFVNGYFLATYIFELGVFGGLILGFIMAGIILILERAFVMSNTNKFLSRLRIALGLIVAILGAIIADEVLFEKEIADQLLTQKMEAQAGYEDLVRDKNSDTSSSLQSQIETLSVQYAELSKQHQEEVNGRGGTGIIGCGAACKALEKKMATKASELKTAQARLGIFEQGIATEIAAFEVDYAGDGFLSKIKALFTLVISDWYMLGVFILVTFFLGLLEFLVVLFKKYSSETDYEAIIEHVSEIQIDRIKKIRDRRAANLKDGKGIVRAKEFLASPMLNMF